MLKIYFYAVAFIVVVNSTCSSVLVFKPAQAILRSANSREFLLAARSSVRMLHSVSPNYTTEREEREIGESYWNIEMAKNLISKKKGFSAMCATEGLCIWLGFLTADSSTLIIDGLIAPGFFGIVPSAIAYSIASNLPIPVDELRKKIKEIK